MNWSLTVVLLSLLCLANSKVVGQFAQISGVIKDQKSQVVPGTNVTVKGTPAGTAVNIDGEFKMQLPEGKYLLTFSFIGYKPTTVELEVKEAYWYRVNVVLVEKKRWNRRKDSHVELIWSGKV